jgi:hypothetical protein
MEWNVNPLKMLFTKLKLGSFTAILIEVNTYRSRWGRHHWGRSLFFDFLLLLNFFSLGFTQL